MGELFRIGKLIVSMRYRDVDHHHKPHVHAAAWNNAVQGRPFEKNQNGNLRQ